MKLIILQGPPASGKSTWVNNYISNLINTERVRTVVVSRDTIRQSTGTYWVPDREDYISVLEDTAMEEALKRGFDVVNDATNLNPKTIKYLQDKADKYGAQVEFVSLYIPFKEALKRDKARGEGAVGKRVLEGFYKRYFKDKFEEEMYKDRRIDTMVPIKEGFRSAVICDLDGTVAIHTSGRSPFEYERVDEDTALRPMVLTLRALADAGVSIIFISGREDVGNCMEKTRHWICREVMGTRPFQLIMRKEGDHRHGYEVKQDLYEDFIKGIWNIIHVFEDDPRCVKMWREQGLQCSQTYDFEVE